ncbi:MAG: hemerythrin domain-containing protein [Burkholderiales bacterium]|nr:hemerythrin domain-containing protein [Burkholderiales bacterium]
MSDASPARAPEPALGWSDAFVLGHEPMDATHREFVALVQAMQTAPEAGLAELLADFEAHARRHFEEEDRWMLETGFPPRDCHMDEHAAVLRSVVEVREMVARGELAQVRRLADALADWFPRHADWLDSALAHWLCKRAYGGKPVVLRRDLKGALGDASQA